MNRYQGLEILKDDMGKRYIRTPKYPEIPLSSDDIYITSTFGDRLDLLSNDYYGNTEDYWIISVANGLSADSLFMTPGTQIRIPQDTLSIKQSYNILNGIGQ